MKIAAGILAALILAIASVSCVHSASAAASCSSLKSIKLANATVTLAELVGAGDLKLAIDGPAPPPAVLGSLPAFCRVAATLAPTSDSSIRIEVWMPAAGWNAKYEGVGNGGWSGQISYPSLIAQLRHGYATASTDTGHRGGGGDASFALGHPEKLIDFAYRSEHEMTVAAKAFVKAFYGSAPKESYWNGCSTGGKQGLTEAQRYPEDYDGVIAGAPANYWTHLMASGVWMSQATLKDPTHHLSDEKLALLHDAVVKACDALDGVSDGVLENPRRCSFEPSTLQCKGGDESNCLTDGELDAVRMIYGGAKNPRTGEQIFPGFEPGSERGWDAMSGGPNPFPITANHFRDVVFKDPNWDFRTLDFDRDVALADRLDNDVLNATNPNLGPFFARGGRLILYHGWNDPLISPRNTINYYESVVRAVGGQTAASHMRLFMVPGMGHCAGGDGPSSFDSVAPLEQWVEMGAAPERIIASRINRGTTTRTRPLCPYPQVAVYKGSGSTDEADNFACKDESSR